MELEFIDPPEPTRAPSSGDHRPGQMGEFVTELKKHPNRWALYSRDRANTLLGLARKRFPEVEWRCVQTEEQRKTRRRELYGIYRVEVEGEEG